jgi:hypothetical protein
MKSRVDIPHGQIRQDEVSEETIKDVKSERVTGARGLPAEETK